MLGLLVGAAVPAIAVVYFPRLLKSAYNNLITPNHVRNLAALANKPSLPVANTSGGQSSSIVKRLGNLYEQVLKHLPRKRTLLTTCGLGVVGIFAIKKSGGISAALSSPVFKR